MMKSFVRTCIVGTLFISGVSHSAEIFNKDGNKLDLYGKVQGEHYLSDNDSLGGDQSYMRFGFRGHTTVNDLITRYGQREYPAQLNNCAGSDAHTNNKTRLGLAVV